MRAAALIAIIPGLQSPSRHPRPASTRSARVASVADEQTRIKLLAELVPLLDAAQLESALTMVMQMRADSVPGAGHHLYVIAPRRTSARAGPDLQEAGACETCSEYQLTLTTRGARPGALAGAAHLMDDADREQATETALQAAIAIPSKWEMERELGRLADELSTAQLDRALNIVIRPIQVRRPGA